MNQDTINGDRGDRMAREIGRAAVQLCSIDETCELLRVSRWQVYQLINRRQLASVKIGRRRLVPLTELTAFIARQREAGVLA